MSWSTKGFKKITYMERPTEKEKEWLRIVYGNNEASIVIHNASRYRRSVNREIAVVQQRRLQGLDDRISNRIIDIHRKYGNVVKKFDSPSDILEDVCLSKVFLTS